MNNILPQEEKREIKKMMRMRLWVAVCGALVLILAMMWVLLIPTELLLKSQLAVLHTQSDSLRARSGAVALDQSIGSLTTQTASLEKTLVLQKDKPFYQTVKTVLGNTYTGIAIQSVSISSAPGAVSVTGVAQDRESLEAFDAQLRALPGVTDIESPLSNFIKSKGGQFSVSIIF
ncbi:MAG: hypothetical protein WCQ32_00705 [bacterium]